MGKRSFISTKDFITGAALPDYGPLSKYAVIGHQEVMDAAEGLLTSNNLVADKTLYKSNMDAEVVRAVYHLEGSTDPEMEMMFAWVNSYDKSKRFQCTIGAHIKASGGYWINGDMGSFFRKHTGSAKQDAMDMMQQQITNAGTYYNTLISNKAEMKMVILPEKLRAELLGRILYEKRFITMEQASIIKSALMTPQDYNCDKDSLWQLNCNINIALKKSHPREWLTRQIDVSGFLNKEFGIGSGNKADPNQISLLDSIAEVEKEQQVSKEPTISFEL